MKKAITLLSSLQGSQCIIKPTKLFLQRRRKGLGLGLGLASAYNGRQLRDYLLGGVPCLGGVVHGFLMGGGACEWH